MNCSYKAIEIKATKKWTDENGKKRQKTKTFYQTLNPFNKNSDGTVKSREQILIEIEAEKESWLTGI